MLDFHGSYETQCSFEQSAGLFRRHGQRRYSAAGIMMENVTQRSKSDMSLDRWQKITAVSICYIVTLLCTISFLSVAAHIHPSGIKYDQWPQGAVCHFALYPQVFNYTHLHNCWLAMLMKAITIQCAQLFEKRAVFECVKYQMLSQLSFSCFFHR